MIKPQFSYSTNFSEGLASAGHYYINKKGDKVIELGSAWGGVFSEGLGRVRGGERGNYIGYIDRVGKFIIEPLFSLSSGWFHEGLAPAQTDSDGKWGFINKKGEFVIKPRFEYACSFSEGLAAVKLDEDGKWGFINKKGEFVIKPQFEIAHKFSEGLSSVQKERGGKWGYIKNPLKMSK